MCLELVNHPTENTFAYSLAYSLVRIYDMASINLLSAWLGFANIDWEWKACILLAKYRETNAFTLFIGRNKWKLIFFPSFLKTSSCNEKLSNYWSASQNLQSCMAWSKVFSENRCIHLLDVSLILVQSAKFHNTVKWNMAVGLGQGFLNSKQLKKPPPGNNQINKKIKVCKNMSKHCLDLTCYKVQTLLLIDAWLI